MDDARATTRGGDGPRMAGDPSQRGRRRLGALIGYRRLGLAAVVSAGILGVLAWQTGVRWSAVGEQFLKMDGRVLAVAFTFSALWHLFVGTDKWWRILRAQGAAVGYWEVFRVRMGSDPLRLVLPLKAGEVVGAVYFGRRGQFGFGRATGSIVFDKALNLFGAVFWMYVGLAAMTAIPPWGQITLHTAVGVAVLVFLVVRPVRQGMTASAAWLHPRLGRFVAGVLSGFEEFSPWQKIGLLLYGILFQCRDFIVCWLLFVASSPERLPSVGELLAYGAIVVLTGGVPLTLAGIGPRETALTLLFLSCGSEASLLSIGLMMSLAITVLPALLGIPLLFPLLRAVARGGCDGRPWQPE